MPKMPHFHFGRRRGCKEWMSRLHWPLAKGEVRYFEEAEAPAAWTWLREGLN